MELNTNELDALRVEVKTVSSLNYQLVRDNAYLMHVVRELRVGHAKQKEQWMEPSKSEYELRTRIESYRAFMLKKNEAEKAAAIQRTDILDLPLLPTGNL